jgi:hypothetical protein
LYWVKLTSMSNVLLSLVRFRSAWITAQAPTSPVW